MSLEAVGFKCIVLPDEVSDVKEVKTDSGIVVKLHLNIDKKMEQNAQTRGTILHIGEDFAEAYKPKTRYWGLKPGDKIWYAKYAGKWIKDEENNREVLVILDEDICVKEVPNE